MNREPTIRRALDGAGDPVYVIMSPCCGAQTVVAAWIVACRIANGPFWLELRCGLPHNHWSIPATWYGSYAGCKQAYEVDLRRVAGQLQQAG
jgi:hypothetical protein